jgi:hypothetical protein
MTFNCRVCGGDKYRSFGPINKKVLHECTDCSTVFTDHDTFSFPFYGTELRHRCEDGTLVLVAIERYADLHEMLDQYSAFLKAIGFNLDCDIILDQED